MEKQIIFNVDGILIVMNQNIIEKKIPLYLAMKKYGVENFKIEIIEETEDEAYCLEQEKHWIDFYKTNICKYGKYFGYNLTDGGEGVSGYVYSEEQKEMRSDRQMGHKNTFFGKNHSQETKNNISIAHIGKPISESTKRKISKKLAGIPKSIETKNKMSISSKGKQKSQEHCNNISLSKIGKSNNRPGSKHHNTKLTEKDVIEIRSYFDSSIEKSKDKIELLSQKYNMSQSGIKQIVYRIKWKHI